MTTGHRGEINVTPLIDVLLVLLITFMIIIPQNSTGLNAQIPRPSHEFADWPPIVVRVGEDRALRINSEGVPWEKLDQRLRQIFAVRAERVMFVSAAPQVDFQDVARVLDVARGAGVDHAALLPK